jgi:hypothetical protein
VVVAGTAVATNLRRGGRSTAIAGNSPCFDSLAPPASNRDGRERACLKPLAFPIRPAVCSAIGGDAYERQTARGGLTTVMMRRVLFARLVVVLLAILIPVFAAGQCLFGQPVRRFCSSRHRSAQGLRLSPERGPAAKSRALSRIALVGTRHENPLRYSESARRDRYWSPLCGFLARRARFRSVRTRATTRT